MDSQTKILTAALALFRTNGFHGTSTAKIAEAAGVSNGTLFHHFKTKEALINVLYITEKEAFKTYIQKDLPVFVPTKKSVKQLWLKFLQHDLAHKDRVSFLAMFSNSPYIDSLSKEEASRYFSFVKKDIQCLIENEVIVDVHPNLIVSSFYASILCAYRFLIEHDLEDDSVQKETAFNLWWRGVVNV